MATIIHAQKGWFHFLLTINGLGFLWLLTKPSIWGEVFHDGEALSTLAILPILLVIFYLRSLQVIRVGRRNVTLWRPYRRKRQMAREDVASLFVVTRRAGEDEEHQVLLLQPKPLGRIELDPLEIDLAAFGPEVVPQLAALLQVEVFGDDLDESRKNSWFRRILNS